MLFGPVFKVRRSVVHYIQTSPHDFLCCVPEADKRAERVFFFFFSPHTFARIYFSSRVARVHVCFLCFSGRLTNTMITLWTGDGVTGEHKTQTEWRRTSGIMGNLNNSSRRSGSPGCLGSGRSEMRFILRFYIHLVRSYPVNCSGTVCVWRRQCWLFTTSSVLP